MKWITYILNKLTPTKIVRPLGRWRTETCTIKMKNKIDLSNEDHCGPFGQYALVKLKNKTKNISK
jgi:hypothetical protein